MPLFPLELFTHVFPHCSHRTLVTLSKTCKYINAGVKKYIDDSYDKNCDPNAVGELHLIKWLQGDVDKLVTPTKLNVNVMIQYGVKRLSYSEAENPSQHVDQNRYTSVVLLLHYLRVNDRVGDFNNCLERLRPLHDDEYSDPDISAIQKIINGEIAEMREFYEQHSYLPLYRDHNPEILFIIIYGFDVFMSNFGKYFLETCRRGFFSIHSLLRNICNLSEEFGQINDDIWKEIISGLKDPEALCEGCIREYNIH